MPQFVNMTAHHAGKCLPPKLMTRLSWHSILFVAHRTSSSFLFPDKGMIYSKDVDEVVQAVLSSHWWSLKQPVLRGTGSYRRYSNNELTFISQPTSIVNMEESYLKVLAKWSAKPLLKDHKAGEYHVLISFFLSSRVDKGFVCDHFDMTPPTNKEWPQEPPFLGVDYVLYARVIVFLVSASCCLNTSQTLIL